MIKENQFYIENILESISDAFFALDENWNFIYLNPEAEQLLMRPKNQVIGKNIWQTFPEIAKTRLFQLYEGTLDKKVSVQFEEYYQPLEVWFEIRTFPAGNNLLIYFHDIHERKQLEQNLVAALAKEKELNQLKSQIITTVSHEFRTPLTVILSSVELIENYGQKWTEEKKLGFFQSIKKSVFQMQNLITDVLIIGKAETGNLEFRPTIINLTSFCRNLIEELELGAGVNYKFNFIVDGQNPEVCMDERLIRQIIGNLLSNAIKYSSPGSRISLEIYYQEKEVTIRVRDEGMGIPESDFGKIFNSFQRGSNVGVIPGTGLGLAIVKKSVELQNGKISFTSKAGGGSTIFTVVLPRSQS